MAESFPSEEAGSTEALSPDPGFMLDSFRLPETLEEVMLCEGTVWNECLDTTQLVALSLRLPPHTALRSAPDLRPLPAEGQPAGDGRNRFQNHPEVRKRYLALLSQA